MLVNFAQNVTTSQGNDECIFQRFTSPVTIFFIYGLVVPTLAAFGLCTNFVNAVVFMRPKMSPSAFTYLAALSWLDCLSCLLITLTALSRSYFFQHPAWIAYDYQWQSPLFGISTGAANLILACVSCDRFIYLTRLRTANGTPRFCRRKVARSMVCIVIVVSIAVNVPYFFVFVVDANGKCHVTEFYFSKFYQVHNWFTFTLLALIPAVLLLIGNAAIIIAFQRWTKQSRRCQQNCPTSNTRTTQKRFQHQMKLTISIVIVITLYLIGELPAHMTARKSALNLVFGGDVSRVDLALMQRLEVICITLNALQLSMNIVVYGVCNPTFMPELFVCLRNASDVCYRICGLTALASGWRRCCTRYPGHTAAEDCVVSSVNCQQQLPEEEPPNCGCESWSTDPQCVNNARHGKPTAAGIFTFRQSDDSEQPVFATKSSACMQLSIGQENETSVSNCNFIKNN